MRLLILHCETCKSLYRRAANTAPLFCRLHLCVSASTPYYRIPPPATMASSAGKNYYDEKTVSPTSSQSPVEVGRSSNVRRRLPKFSLEVRQEESSFARTKNASNADFDPIPPSKRTWTWGAYIAYWMADAWAVSNWEVGESPAVNLRSVLESVTLLSMHSCSFLHHRRRPRLEIRYRGMCTWQYYHGSRHYHQRSNGCHCGL